MTEATEAAATNNNVVVFMERRPVAPLWFGSACRGNGNWNVPKQGEQNGVQIPWETNGVSPLPIDGPLNFPTIGQVSHQLELTPVEYHLAYYPLLEDADWTEFEKFLESVAAKPKYPDYVCFSSNLSRVEIVRKLERCLRAEFYYVLVFARADGTFYLGARPDACRRARLQLPATEQQDMMKCFDAVAAAVELKADVKYNADQKRNG